MDRVHLDHLPRARVDVGSGVGLRLGDLPQANDLVWLWRDQTQIHFFDALIQFTGRTEHRHSTHQFVVLAMQLFEAAFQSFLLICKMLNLRFLPDISNSGSSEEYTEQSGLDRWPKAQRCGLVFMISRHF